MTQGKILFLGQENCDLIPWLQAQGEQVIQNTNKISCQYIKEQNIDFIISYGYRHILTQEILSLLPNKAINLHISYLPYNRGADPNFWSFVENTPKGVTIHYLDKGVDTGDIIIQEEIKFDLTQETLATSYKKLQALIESLFKRHWQSIKRGKCHRKKQIGQGSVHKIKDKEALSHLLINGWDTSVAVLNEYALKK